MSATVGNNTRLNEGQNGDLIRTIEEDGVKTQVIATNIVSTSNGTSTPLSGAAVYTGTWEDVGAFDSVVVAMKADVAGSLAIQFSIDASNIDSTLTYEVDAAVNEFHRVSVTRRYFRIVYTNGSAAQSYFRLQCIKGTKQLLASPLNATVQQDADAIITRNVSEETMTAEGKLSGRMIVTKFGRNQDIDTGSVPEDIWNGGGTYAGFPTGAAEEFQVFSSSASDTGVLTFTYLADFTSTAYAQATVTLNGTTPVNTGVTGVRMHTCNYSSGTATTFNVGTITVRHRTTTANIFCVMPIGRSQTNVAAYTVPFGSTGYIRRLFARLIGATSGSADGALWVRTRNGSPRLRRPFTVAQSDAFEEYPYGGIVIPALADVQVRITTVSANNLDIIAGYDMVVVEN